MSFSSQDNKRLLWGLMADMHVFNGIPDNKVEQVKILFEQEITRIDSNQGSLMDKNKTILSTMNTKLNSLRVSAVVQQPPSNAVTNKDIAQERREAMNNKLHDKQNEFNKMISGEKPKEIDFADEPDDKPIGSEMDSLLEAMRAKRENELNQVMQTQDTSSAEKWISNEGAGTGVNVNPPTLHIGEKVETPPVTVVGKPPLSPPKNKHVTFANDSADPLFEDSNKKHDDSSMNLLQFLSSKSDSPPKDAPFMPPEDDPIEKKQDIMETRSAAAAESRRFVENEILQRLSRIEQEFIEVKDLLKNI